MISRTRQSAAIVALLSAIASGCSSPPAKTTPNIQTTLGMLAEAERRSNADPANSVIAPKSGEVAYVLTFKGSIAIPDYENGWEKRFPILDGQGREYPPVAAGTPDATGKLTQDTYRLTGSAGAITNGALTFKGTASVPEGVLVLAYIVPTGAQGLSLKDGAAQHPLGR
jgi:hypothetical protein